MQQSQASNTNPLRCSVHTETSPKPCRGFWDDDPKPNDPDPICMCGCPASLHLATPPTMLHPRGWCLNTGCIFYRQKPGARELVCVCGDHYNSHDPLPHWQGLASTTPQPLQGIGGTQSGQAPGAEPAHHSAGVDQTDPGADTFRPPPHLPRASESPSPGETAIPIPAQDPTQSTSDAPPPGDIVSPMPTQAAASGPVGVTLPALPATFIPLFEDPRGVRAPLGASSNDQRSASMARHRQRAGGHGPRFTILLNPFPATPNVGGPRFKHKKILATEGRLLVQKLSQHFCFNLELPRGTQLKTAVGARIKHHMHSSLDAWNRVIVPVEEPETAEPEWLIYAPRRNPLQDSFTLIASALDDTMDLRRVNQISERMPSAWLDGNETSTIIIGLKHGLVTLQGYPGSLTAPCLLEGPTHLCHALHCFSPLYQALGFGAINHEECIPGCPPKEPEVQATVTTLVGSGVEGEVAPPDVIDMTVQAHSPPTSIISLDSDDDSILQLEFTHPGRRKVDKLGDIRWNILALQRRADPTTTGSIYFRAMGSDLENLVNRLGELIFKLSASPPGTTVRVPGLTPVTLEQLLSASPRTFELANSATGASVERSALESLIHREVHKKSTWREVQPDQGGSYFVPWVATVRPSSAQCRNLGTVGLTVAIMESWGWGPPTLLHPILVAWAWFGKTIWRQRDWLESIIPSQKDNLRLWPAMLPQLIEALDPPEDAPAANKFAADYLLFRIREQGYEQRSDDAIKAAIRDFSVGQYRDLTNRYLAECVLGAGYGACTISGESALSQLFEGMNPVIARKCQKTHRLSDAVLHSEGGCTIPSTRDGWLGMLQSIYHAPIDCHYVMQRLDIEHFQGYSPDEMALLRQRLVDYLSGLGHPASEDGFIEGMVGPAWEDDKHDPFLRSKLFVRAITGRRFTPMDVGERMTIKGSTVANVNTGPMVPFPSKPVFWSTCSNTAIFYINNLFRHLLHAADLPNAAHSFSIYLHVQLFIGDTDGAGIDPNHFNEI